MTVASVVREVCAFVGVRAPNGSIFVTPEQNRTVWEMVQLANEMAQRIAYDTRDWTALRKRAVFSPSVTAVDPPPVTEGAFNLPADMQRMLLTAQVWRSTNSTAPMTFVLDADAWLRGELQGETASFGEWIIEGGQMLIRPGLASRVLASPGDPLADPPVPPRAEIPPETATFYYLRNTCVRSLGGILQASFMADDDSFVLPERLLKLGMIWQWKAYKGGTYAEDIANYEDALANVAGADKPAPIIIGSQTISSDANVAYWGPVPPASTRVGPDWRP